MSLPKKLSRRKKILFYMVIIFFPILIAEALARVLWFGFIYEPVTQEQRQEKIFWEEAWQKDIPYVFKPDICAEVAHTPAHFNNLGFRGSKDIQLSGANQRVRIICVGDSVTFGYTVSGDEQAYPAVLEALLIQQGMDCEVVNAGMPAFHLIHVANLFDKHICQLRPALVIVLGGWNDISNALHPNKGKFQRFLKFMDGHVYLFKVFKDWHQRSGLWSPRASRLAAYIDEDQYRKSEDALHRLIASSRRVGAIPLLCTLPHFAFDTPEARGKLELFFANGTGEQIGLIVDEFNRRIQVLGNSEQVQVVDLRSVADESLFSDVIHPNDRGSARIASIIAYVVVQDVWPKIAAESKPR